MTTLVMAWVTTIATVAIVLRWVVMRCEGWYWRRCCWRSIQANDTAIIFSAFIAEHDGSADDAILASKVLQESSHLVIDDWITVSCTDRLRIKRASRLGIRDVRVLQGVEDGTHARANKILIK